MSRPNVSKDAIHIASSLNLHHADLNQPWAASISRWPIQLQVHLESSDRHEVDCVSTRAFAFVLLLNCALFISMLVLVRRKSLIPEVQPPLDSTLSFIIVLQDVHRQQANGLYKEGKSM